MSKEQDSGSRSNCTIPQLLWAMSHPPPVSPQLFDAALLIALVTLQACLPSPLLSGQMALHFLCVPLCLALCLALEPLTNYLSDEWIQIKFRLTINLLQRMESSISGNCIEVIGSEIKLLKCLLDTWVSDFLGQCPCEHERKFKIKTATSVLVSLSCQSNFQTSYYLRKIQFCLSHG